MGEGEIFKDQNQVFSESRYVCKHFPNHLAPPSEDLVVVAKLGIGGMQVQSLLPAHSVKETTITTAEVDVSE